MTLASAMSSKNICYIALRRSSSSISGDEYSNYPCGASKGSDGGFLLKEAVTRVRTSLRYLLNLQAHEKLTFLLTRNRRVNIRKIWRFKRNRKIKYVVGNIINANVKMPTESHLLLLIILRSRRREKRKPEVWVKQAY